MNLHQLLLDRASAGRPIRVGLIGAGKFGSMFLAQAARTPGMHIMGIADLSPARAQAATTQVGWPAERTTARTAGQTLPATAAKYAGMALRTLRYLPCVWAQGARAGAHLTVSPRASVEGARRVLQRRKARAAEALRRRGAR